MRSGEDHCHQELADEVRRGRRKKEEEEGGGRGKKEGKRRSRASNIKSNNPHLAGGELNTYKTENPNIGCLWIF